MVVLARRLVRCFQISALRRALKLPLNWSSVLLRVALIIIVLETPLCLYRIYVNSVEEYFYQVEENLFKNITNGLKYEEQSCKFPLYDPFDKQTKPYIFNYPPVSCGQPQPYLTYVDGDGYIHINYTGAREAGLNKQDFRCTYEEVLRVPNSDDEVTFSRPHPIRDGKQLTAAFVRARCKRRRGGRLLYETLHAWVKPLSEEQEARVLPATPTRPSVLVLGIDSMSRLNFIRQLPRTHALLTDVFGATVFTGMTRVGQNTYANFIPMLTGMAARKRDDLEVVVWEKLYGPFDDLPAVWKKFNENGYITMYTEDVPIYMAFNYMAAGFKKQPTDYYTRPFWLAMENSSGFESSDGRCYGNIPQYEFLFNYTREFVEKMRDKRYFAFSFVTGYSHHSINEVQVLDEPLRAFLEGLWRSDALKNTVVIVLGDHGNRFDDFRATVLGRVESNLPYLTISLPPATRAAKPHLQEGLQRNNATFITWYDVYELLSDLALANLQAASRVARFGQVGWSLFRGVPARTCPQAGVPWEYCVCVREVALRAGDAAARAAGRALVAHVNALLADRARPAGPCARLELARVLSAQLLLPSAAVAGAKGFAAALRVTVRVSPSGALLEGRVERDAWNLQGRVQGDVARINQYGNQSHCLTDRLLRYYCYCVDLLPRPVPHVPSPLLSPSTLAVDAT
ncbi:hypothetical protein R5R35_003642 [Gryllus longicercus]|uniref:Uncharacterized protein n=2 Tax=Gryllus longicercus TaxID=2509291 RepID=A0AAN9Z946_9ORTH